MSKSDVQTRKEVTKLNLPEAITLRKHMEEIEDLPKTQLLDNGKGSYLLFIKSELVNAVHFFHLERIAEENNLSLSYGLGYWILIDI
jgi:hypothetical protein